MSKHSRSKTVWRVILAIVSVLVIVALATVAVIYRPTWIHADSPVTQRSSVSRTVSPRQLETYCPARMTMRMETGNIKRPTAISCRRRVMRPSVRCSALP